MSSWDNELAELNQIVSLHHYALSTTTERSSYGAGGSSILGQFLSSNNLTSNLQEITRWRTAHCFPTVHLWQLVGVVGGKPQTFDPRCQDTRYGGDIGHEVAYLDDKAVGHEIADLNDDWQSHHSFHCRCQTSKSSLGILGLFLLQTTSSIFRCYLGWDKWQRSPCWVTVS